MYKLVLTVLMMVVWMLMHALQTDEEMAMAALFQGKHAVNRAAHAAAQQLEKEAVADGRLHIDEIAASNAAALYLQANLLLDETGQPLPGTYWRDRAEVAVFEVINDDRTFPYTYRNDRYDYEVTLYRPGVIMILKLTYPRIFTVLEPIEWQIKGAAELVAH
ncbi:hypothetical protein [Paenibacillus spongiae]|uniref:Uncharacterized protein n=1 Tax=Paenibacillus spongiae TaxID=2909671 RepID=A0ABY5SEY0_9BACL|nr:hypothetical protein [Paenibacillus spongiae]UVI31317.1 hypothetical protein L1F29_05595 [Paenibacillus spongiae]